MMDRKKEIKPFKIQDSSIYNFIINEDITFLNLDALELINKYKDDEKKLLILDPPYISTCNDYYTNSDMNIYEHLYNNNINSFKGNIILILENIWLNKLLFKTNFISESYEKLYQHSKKKTSHIIIKQIKEKIKNKKK